MVPVGGIRQNNQISVLTQVDHSRLFCEANSLWKLYIQKLEREVTDTRQIGLVLKTSTGF